MRDFELIKQYNKTVVTIIDCADRFTDNKKDKHIIGSNRVMILYGGCLLLAYIDDMTKVRRTSYVQSVSLENENELVVTTCNTVYRLKCG